MQPNANTPANNPAKTAGIILLICAALLAGGMFTKGWASASEGRDSIGAGLFGFEGCGRGRCSTLGWDDGARRLDIASDVGTFRIIGLVGGFLALAGMIAAGALALAGNPGKIPIKPVQVALGVASGSLTYFAIRLAMSDRDVNFGPSYSAFMAIAALIVAGVVLQRVLRPLVERGQHASGAPASA